MSTSLIIYPFKYWYPIKKSDQRGWQLLNNMWRFGPNDAFYDMKGFHFINERSNWYVVLIKLRFGPFFSNHVA